ncbi:NAD-dependent epimerase/dehydratase family protein [Lentilactobacillus sp. SPB1-3]|uniref:NAD-dependent epimerase/dehydratase family protein n=1 Tax=Lentilactobacillus terminaliae TaxID=3003483 RepID=A0ACD5DDG6_9LACO|nr:NAD-dependent epimerase/dehydratase family protein [Lentilactobacillus sp. SPB1-3]MCZ0977753.1 NAD-dependent epimerase/dehydratase family protein [Lentilactobacillus sp. SPB1-3]
MQTILGSNGQIGHELAEELYQNYTKELRLVSRHPKQIHPSDQTVAANLLDYNETLTAIEGSEIVYFTAGLPMNSDIMEQQFLGMLDNVIKASKQAHSKLVFFDNTYMYPKTATPQTETSPIIHEGRKSTVRARMAERLVAEIELGELPVVICRAPEFYGPDNTKSITNSMIFNRIKAGKRAFVPINDQVVRTLIWTPDASRAMALIGNTDSAYGQTWHLPTPKGITYQEMINISERVLGKRIKYSVVIMWTFKLGSWFNPALKESLELLPRYQVDNVFLSDKFQEAFPDFQITSFEEGITQILTK